MLHAFFHSTEIGVYLVRGLLNMGGHRTASEGVQLEVGQ